MRQKYTEIFITELSILMGGEKPSLLIDHQNWIRKLLFLFQQLVLQRNTKFNLVQVFKK